MIKEFKGKYADFSNFAKCQVEYEGIIYPSSEHAYMSAKNDAKAWKEFCANPDNTPGTVKKRGKKVLLRPDWEEVKVSIMEEILRKKFSIPHFKELLLSTGTQEIQEGNYWGDREWGVCLKTGKGKNLLGKLLMKIREEISV